MPVVKDNSSFKPGSICRIRLENFVTYKDVVLFPGPTLNMIIGPNGTGKSTFMFALILGLCGSSTSIGTNKLQLSNYVRRGSEKATIEIELYAKRGQKNKQITYTFNKNGKSQWFIDNIPATQTTVIELIKGFNIQVDNLCALLPQDRVRDFTKMNEHTLLRSTLTAIGLGDQLNVLDQLKTCQKKQSVLIENLKKNKQMMEELTRQNEM